MFPNYTKESPVNQYLENDILMGNIRPYLNKIWKATRSGGASNDVNIFRVKDGIDSDFLYYMLVNSKFMNYVMLTVMGTKMPCGNKELILLYNTHLPSLPEQEKIANFLSAQDELIEKEEEKLNLLKEQKKGLLQQMFV